MNIDLFLVSNYELVDFSYFLPTFMEQDKLKPPYVAKPTWDEKEEKWK
ncbi:MAG: hypothetical protein KME29_28165 [Calothrix sp. FI2-JRJ7]|nr:hypothetical protein [Calothrix sp. FI2-JRJ7]